MPDARVTNTITGRDAFLRVLSDEGVVKMCMRSLPRRRWATCSACRKPS